MSRHNYSEFEFAELKKMLDKHFTGWELGRELRPISDPAWKVLQSEYSTILQQGNKGSGRRIPTIYPASEELLKAPKIRRNEFEMEYLKIQKMI